MLVEVIPIPHSSKSLLPESVVCLQIWRANGQESKIKWQKEGGNSSSSYIPPPSQSSRWIPRGMSPWLYRVTATAPLHQTHGTHLPLWVIAMVPQTPVPLRKGREGRKRRRMSGRKDLPWYNTSVLKEAVDGAQEITICLMVNHTGFTTLLWAPKERAS